MKQLQAFSNDEFGTIRTLEVDGDPWFIGKEVAKALGYGDGKSLANAVANHVDADDKGVTEMMTPGGKQPVTIINESGLYSLVLSSKLPTAKKFKRWITHEVIPSIRKHGTYMTPETIEQVLLNPDTVIKLATELKEERQKRVALEDKVEADQPKVIFADAVSSSKTSILIGEFAKILKQNGVNIGQNRFFAWLRQNGYLVKRNGIDFNMPTQKSMNLGLFEIKETSIVHSDGHTSISKTPKLTGKGQIYFSEVFLHNFKNGEAKQEK